jgi:chaperonin GroEL
MNAMRGTLKIAAIKAPFYGNERRDTLSDLAASVGAVFITRESGIKLNEVQLKHLGSARSVEGNKYSTTFVGGNADFEEIENRIESLKNEIKSCDDMQLAELMQGRIVRLVSGVAVIKVGGTTQVEMTEKKHRIEDALEAVRSAQEDGIVAGGGSALLRAAQNLAVCSENPHGDQSYGVSIVVNACRAPITQMALNAGLSPDIIIEKVLNADTGQGWDFRNDNLTNMISNGIIDPVKVTKTALQNASSCAGTLITTNYGIIQTEAE